MGFITESLSHEILQLKDDLKIAFDILDNLCQIFTRSNTIFKSSLNFPVFGTPCIIILKIKKPQLTSTL